MKNWGAASGNSKDSEEQTAQWIQIDRGENAEEEDSDWDEEDETDREGTETDSSEGDE